MRSGGSPAVSSPLTAMLPARGRMRPASAFKTVVLPEPLPPRRATTFPSGTSKETSRKTSVTPYHTLR